MSIKQRLNDRPVMVVCGVTIVVALAGWFTWRQLNPAVHFVDSAFYTNDDGASYYRDSNKLTPPVMKEGKEAVIARVFVIDGQKKVGYMERMTPESRAIIADFKQKQQTAKPTMGPPADLGRVTNASRNGREYKKPGAAKWVSIRDKAAVEQVCRVVDSAGNAAVPVDP
jgi:hypothetical protein